MNKKESEILKNIIQIRNKQRLTQKDIADKMKISDSTISRIEKGDVALSYENLAGIANALAISVIDLIAYPETYVPSKEQKTRKILVEVEVTEEEFSRMGIREKIVNVK
jgi:transcriptional regulator with XRE-family HTH domain